MIDPGPIGELSARLMDALEEEFPDCELSNVVIVAEVRIELPDGTKGSAGRYMSSADSAGHSLGILMLASDQIRQPYIDRGED